MLYRRAIDRFLIVAVPAGLFIYLSARPVTRLRPDMPPAFAVAPPHASAAQRALEQRAAQAYWNCAVTLIQWRYPFGSSLPDTPPDEFNTGGEQAGGVKSVQNSEIRYWRRLRRFWDMPSSWTKSREWSTQWLTDPFGHGIEGIREYFRNLIRTG